MAKKSTVVYTIDLLVHIELVDGVPFKAMQQAIDVIEQEISCITGTREASTVPIIDTITIDRTVIQKKVTY